MRPKKTVNNEELFTVFYFSQKIENKKDFFRYSKFKMDLVIVMSGRF